VVPGYPEKEVHVSFKENLKNKMLIESLCKTVSRSIGSSGMPTKVNKEGMRRLLSLSPFVPEKRRDLELYFREFDEGVGEILVLDNELPLYGKTSLDDVTLRRSPELKEMISIRNIIKILNDSDILIHKRRESLYHVRDRALELLDLRYEQKDIEEMADEGIEAVVRADSDGVMEILELFFEVLGYEPAPVEVTVNDFVVFGARHGAGAQQETLGPVVMYNEKTNVLRLIKQSVPIDDPVARDLIPNVALGKIEPDAKEFAVFRFLKDEVLKRPPPTVH
jgi:hypothetical protein